MAGIIFLKTKDLQRIREFYTGTVGMTVWLEQPDITILRHENLLIGFQQHGTSDTAGVLTFFYPGKSDVDVMYWKLRDAAEGPPRTNERYRIYNFFARDPDGR
ncbi:MAG: VOC family protein, partial [Dehalococcoidia bacterium]|nr:VOC family protein [Dehalococcoidia bacterium]